MEQLFQKKDQDKGQKGKSLYQPQEEHDACGIGFIANIKNKKSHQVVRDAVTMLENMEHRGACGCEPETGDGAGILIQMPHEFLFDQCQELGIILPEIGQYGSGIIFFPSDKDLRVQCRQTINKHAYKLGLDIIGYRDVEINNEGIGATAKSVEPKIRQIFIKPMKQLRDPMELERKLFVFRKFTNQYIHRNIPGTYDTFNIVSLSYKTLIYKGQLRTFQLKQYFTELNDERVKSAIALIHSRFSTNTFPKWKLAQPFRYIAHNGEINTIRGNINWMNSNKAMFESEYFSKEEFDMMLDICDPERSDSSNIDNAIELLTLAGRPLPMVMMLLIPEAWQEAKDMEDFKRAFYEFYGSSIEPWDGPASICFTDGKIVGATLDRNGLRPSRYIITEDDRVIMSSEAGALRVDPSIVKYRGRLKPGMMFVVDLEKQRVISDDEIKRDICNRHPYRKWLLENRIHIKKLPVSANGPVSFDNNSLLQRQHVYGFTEEDLKVILQPMAESGKEPIGSMGSDTPLAALSKESQHISNYFKQLFAQVSNPPMDPIRERLVMSLYTSVGKTYNILTETPEHCKQIHFEQPVLTNTEVDKLKNITHPDYKSAVVDAVFNADGKPGRLEEGIDRICHEAAKAVENGANIIIISDRQYSENYAPIPSLLAVGAIHEYLVSKILRAKTGLVVETGDTREVHHFATLIGFGANVVNPYMAFETIHNMREKNIIPQYIPEQQLFDNYVQAVGKGLLKVFSKMGISTLQSYHGAQIFEIIGLNSEVVQKCFKNTISRVDGISFDGLAKEVLVRHRVAYSDIPKYNNRLAEGGVYQWKQRGEKHLFNPDTIRLLQKSARNNDYDIYKEYASLINKQSEQAFTLRGLFDFKDRNPVPIEEVESKEEIFKRFATGAMSFGSISYEAHSTLAIAMNRIKGKSNSGEGGEDPDRFKVKPNGDWERSATKQVASGRFGVNSYYLTNAVELQIKMAQGAKPGEGGQLPGHKVDEWIGRVRNSTPGVGLISPPPHHDIYSIEDLAQLIFDLKNANRDARINVKLVSKAGVGTIAAGVAKGHADVVLISGGDGGTGASPISSIRHTGLPWELGLAETHQTLVQNNLRSRIVVQVDGQMKTGRDLAIATLLGAEEWGVSTAALVAEGCILMRACHKNTCPVGIATQDVRLRKKFAGKPEHVVNFFSFMAEELREIMAQLGFRTINEMVGQADLLKVRDDIEFWKPKSLDLSQILYRDPDDRKVGIYKMMEQDHGINDVLDWKLFDKAKPAFESGKKVTGSFPVQNVDRAVGALISNEISKKYDDKGLPDGTIHYTFKGSAGQSFGAFAAKGLRFELEGEANDYFGKGLSGAQLIVYPHKESKYKAEENFIVGNVSFYGATGGEAYIRGLAGERFCVRNSGAKVVVEGVGDHGCEYMTGGIAVVLGETGKNFAAGMSGGVAYVYDPLLRFEKNCNKEMVLFEPLEDQDKKDLKSLIDNHLKFTNSVVAEKILDDWERNLYSFTKVMPTDYKAVLLKGKKKAQQKKKEPEKVEMV